MEKKTVATNQTMNQIVTVSGGQKEVMTASGEQIMNSGPQEDGSIKSARETRSQARESPAEAGEFQLNPNAPTFVTFANPLLSGTA